MKPRRAMTALAGRWADRQRLLLVIALPELLELGAMVMLTVLVTLTPAESLSVKVAEKVPALVGVPEIGRGEPVDVEPCRESPGGNPVAEMEYGGVPPEGAAFPVYAFPTAPFEEDSVKSSGAGGAVPEVAPRLNHM
jgi:hypothetical protein